LHTKAKKKFKATTDSKHNLPVAPNLLNRDFIATAPNQKWVGDISYFNINSIKGTKNASSTFSKLF